jgi:hypothetical protein
MGEVMPETLEVMLWCAALATWLMLLFAFLSDGYKSLSHNVHRLVDAVLRAKAK